MLLQFIRRIINAKYKSVYCAASIARYYGSEAEDNEDKRLVFRLIEMLTSRGYTARGCVLLNELDVSYWYGWPDDIVWQHKNATRV